MATNLQTYSACYVSVNNVLLAEEASMSFSQDTALIPVKSVVKGFSGASVGASMSSFTIDMNVPIDGLELPTQDELALGLTPIDFSFAFAGVTNQFKGYVQKLDYSHSVDNSMKITMSGIGTFGLNG